MVAVAQCAARDYITRSDEAPSERFGSAAMRREAASMSRDWKIDEKNYDII